MRTIHIYSRDFGKMPELLEHAAHLAAAGEYIQFACPNTPTANHIHDVMCGQHGTKPDRFVTFVAEDKNPTP